jgi:hypothetical protein
VVLCRQSRSCGQVEVGAVHELETDLSYCKHENSQLKEQVAQQHALLRDFETRVAQFGAAEADTLALAALQSAQTEQRVERLEMEQAASKRLLIQKTGELDAVQQRARGMTTDCMGLAIDIDHLGQMLARKSAEVSEWRARASHLQRGMQAEQHARQADRERYKAKSVRAADRLLLHSGRAALAEKWYRWRGRHRSEERMLSVAPMSNQSESAAERDRSDEDDADKGEDGAPSMLGSSANAGLLGWQGTDSDASVAYIGLPSGAALGMAPSKAAPGRRGRRDTGKPW